MDAFKTKYMIFSHDNISDELRVYNLIIDGVTVKRRQYVD